jgi:hypothetical protein
MKDFSDLKEKIAEAKRRLPMPDLLVRLGLGEHAKKNAHCLWHHDEHPSFSVFQDKNGWQHKCHVGCSSGDEIAFLVKHFGISRREAINRFLDMAGFPSGRAPKSHEFPQFPLPPGCLGSLKSPESLEYPVHPVSNGQGLEEELKGLAGRNACSERNTARKRRWQFVRDLRAVEERIGRKLSNGELMQVFNEWHRISQAFLDAEKTRDDYLAAFLAELGKVRVPTGEGETIKKALEHALALPISKLPVIPGMADAPESWRRVLALHRELSRRSTKTNKTYFLGCRDAASVFPSLNHQTAHNINLALVQLGVIRIVRVGDRRPNGKASEFRYLLPQTENGALPAENDSHASEPDDCPF